jgi:hypothetical protein
VQPQADAAGELEAVDDFAGATPPPRRPITSATTSRIRVSFTTLIAIGQS